MSWPAGTFAIGVGTMKARRLLSLAALLLGLILIIKGGYMQAKAEFAQFLIARAFEQSLVDGQPHKPWDWADTYPVARLELLKGGLPQQPLYVLAGASGRNLAFGPAWLEGTARPGAPGHSVIAGHRDSHFAQLRGMAVGDKLLLTPFSGRQQLFEVSALRIVSEHDGQALAEVEDGLTLVTCYPFDALGARSEKRLLVFAKPMAKPRANAAAQPAIGMTRLRPSRLAS
ncbi:class GN sortase [Shewanella cyperi]|nr:class GN sortase [Shewanella cyperi]